MRCNLRILGLPEILHFLQKEGVSLTSLSFARVIFFIVIIIIIIIIVTIIIIVIRIYSYDYYYFQGVLSKPRTAAKTHCTVRLTMTHKLCDDFCQSYTWTALP